MSEETHKQLIEKINSGKFSDFDAVTFDKDGSYVTVSGNDFQKLMSKKANFPTSEKVVSNFLNKIKNEKVI